MPRVGDSITAFVVLLLAAHASAAPDGVPVLTATDFSVDSFVAPAFLTNGFIGLRPGPAILLPDPFAGAAPRSSSVFDPTVPATVAGFLYRDVSLHSVLAPAPYPLATDVLLDGCTLLGNDSVKMQVKAQSLDMSSGELSSQLEFLSGSTRVQLNVTAFLSRTAPTLAAMRVTAAVDPPGVHNLTLAPIISVETESPGNFTVPATTYNSTVPDLKTMPGWASWVWDASVRMLGFETNLGSRLGLAALPNTTRYGDMVVYEVVISTVSSATLPAGADPVLSAYEHVKRGGYLGGFSTLQVSVTLTVLTLTVLSHSLCTHTHCTVLTLTVLCSLSLCCTVLSPAVL